MKISKEKENDFNASFDGYNSLLNVYFSDDRDDEDELEETEVEERQDWGDVDPAGGEAPAAPGSAV